MSALSKRRKKKQLALKVAEMERLLHPPPEPKAWYTVAEILSEQARVTREEIAFQTLKAGH